MKLVELKKDNWIQADGYRKSILLTAKDFNQEGCLAQIVVGEPGSKIKPHYHQRIVRVDICDRRRDAVYYQP